MPAVQITIQSPTNGGQATLSNVQGGVGTVTATGTLDQTVNNLGASIQPTAGGPSTNDNEGTLHNVQANSNWQFTFSGAKANTSYKLTVTGNNSNGVGSSSITFTAVT
jgi:hypothetical protein